MTEKTIDHRLAWLAGIIDGEGWIGFAVLKHKRTKSHRHAGARWNIEICNTDYALLAEVIAVAGLLGVHVKYNPRAGRPGKHNMRKAQGRVSFNSKDACRTVLQSVYPYLIAKRPQAELMLQALAHRNRLGGGIKIRPDVFPGWIPVSQDRTFIDMAERVREMNRRGTAPVEG